MVLVAVATLTPACIWLWYIYRQDKRPEPLVIVAVAFVAGIAAAAPVCYIQKFLFPFLPAVTGNRDFLQLFLSTTILFGLVEELAKFLIVLGLLATVHDFDEPVDGLIYAAAVAAGFTAAEDFLRHIVAVDWGRLVRPPGHVLFAMLWGYPLGRRLITGHWMPVLAGLASAVIVHGLWDAFCAYSVNDPAHSQWTPIVIVMLAALLFWRLERRLRLAQLRRSHRLQETG